MLELKGVQKTFGTATAREVRLFDNFNLTIADKEFVSLVGSNGSGKTTLLNIICGSLPQDKGSVVMDGRDISGQKEYVRAWRIGRIHQNPAWGTVGNMTILENLSLADNKQRRMGFRQGTDPRRVEYYKELLRPLGLGLENMLSARAGSLSGGERQALAMVTATMTPVDFLILDEHTAALDPQTAETIMTLTDRLVREKGLTTIMITHNLRYALAVGDRLIMMHKGKIVLDKKGEDKMTMQPGELLQLFGGFNYETPRTSEETYAAYPQFEAAAR